ncbi:MAG: hypothetical protein ACJAQZ_002062 [Planctomycetota bacterium]|jgi:hypothetical protein
MNRLAMSLLAALLLSSSVFAQRPADHLALGKMWTFENPPLAYLEKEYGFKPDQKWLNSLRLGALRLGERDNPWCSASFVSPKGLIMTNHHCVRDQIAQVQGANKWVKDGFAATALADEVRIPGLTVQQLIAQEDVTAQVGAGIEATDDDVTIAAKRKANIDAIVTAADVAHKNVAHQRYMHQVVSLYQGAVYQLYRYRVWDDLRLVVAPHLQTAHYGGDPDNFTFPRWSIDFSFVRAYVDDKPADTSAHYFRWRNEGAKDGELVFVPGNPGNTNRQMTMQQLHVQREVEYPMVLEQFKNSIAILEPFKDRAPQFLTTLLGWQNSYKAIKGMLEGLENPALMKKKQDHEQHFRGVVAEDKELGKQYGDLWREFNKLVGKQRELMPKAMFYQPGFSSAIQRGLLIAQSFDKSVDAAERETAQQNALEFSGGSSPLTHALLIDQFERAANWLRADDAFLIAVGGEHRSGRGTDWAAAIGDLNQSKLSSDLFVQRMLTEADAEQQWQQSDDIGVQAARVLWPLMQTTETQQKALDDGLAQQGTRLGRALHKVYGSNISPDATMTLRFSDGRVKGYEYNGTLAPWATTFYGLYGRGIEFGNAYPFDIPSAWLESQAKIDLSKKVCFASTNDIVGGNSGSCVVDQQLRVVGLVFDGNIESLPNDFYFSQDVARAVNVHTDAIIEALQHVYGMMRIVEELRDGAGR